MTTLSITLGILILNAIISWFFLARFKLKLEKQLSKKQENLDKEFEKINQNFKFIEDQQNNVKKYSDKNKSDVTTQVTNINNKIKTFEKELDDMKQSKIKYSG